MAKQIVSKVSAETVRAWGEANGFPRKSRGRLSTEHITAYNKANPKAKFVQGAQPEPAHMVTLSKVNGFTPPKRVKVTVKEARAYAGVTKGRLSQETLIAAAVAKVTGVNPAPSA